MIELSQLKKVHIVGIGGIGISAIAHMLLEGNPQIGLGKCEVSGSDSSLSVVTERLEKKGAKIFAGHDASHVPVDVDCLLYTVAVGEENPEVLAAKERGVPVLTYSEILGSISSHFYTIAVSGTHGKTTTTAMLGKVLKDAGLDPTVIVGSLLKESGSNLILGKSKYLVVEADEYRRSFTTLSPSILVITNIDEDHLDYYKDLADIQNAFAELAAKLPHDGLLICKAEDPHLVFVAKHTKARVADYTRVTARLKLWVPGKHNLENAHAALVAARFLGVPEKTAVESLDRFEGTWRRFEYRGKMASGALVYDDYAHNPQKVRAALHGAREMFPDKKIVAVFGPHLFSRTKILLREFGESFADADRVIVTDIYPAREAFDPTIHAKDVVVEISKHGKAASFGESFDAIASDLKSSTDSETVVVLIGAGDIYGLGSKLTEGI